MMAWFSANRPCIVANVLDPFLGMVDVAAVANGARTGVHGVKVGTTRLSAALTTGPSIRSTLASFPSCCVLSVVGFASLVATTGIYGVAVMKEKERGRTP